MDINLNKKDLIPADLPAGIDIVSQGKKIGLSATIGRTLFMQKHGVSSEAEYKRKMMSDGKIMFHVVFGLNSWQECVNGMKHIYEETAKRGTQLDRWTIILARPMGLPESMRGESVKETGLMLYSPEEWLQLGQIVPVQPHLGDQIIGSPASVENVLLALSAGTTTIGNLAQYFGYEYPNWTDDISRTISTVKALGIMAQLKDKGVVVTSNLDDGPSCLLHDRANYIGWAMLEKYLVEDLIGAKYAPHYGNVVTDPQMRLAILLALNNIHKNEMTGAFINGNTIYTQDIEKNISILSSCLLFDIIGQLKNPTGHAVHAVPLTEHDRIPSPDEIVQIIVMANQMEEQARQVFDIIDFNPVEKIKERIITGGQLFYNKVMNGLAEAGINTSDPIELLLALKKIGTRKIEELFGAGKRDKAVQGSRKPIIATEIFHHTMMAAEQAKADIARSPYKKNRKKRILLLSTDVHEYAKFVIGIALREAGIEVLDIGHSIDPNQVVQSLLHTQADGICISTHNGMALSYAKNLQKKLKQYNLELPVFMGGRLNEIVEETLPKDVTSDLIQLKIIPCSDTIDILNKL